ncbi:MAG TPA: hypothetical protein VET85_15415 [Stellaceae bacterium]|nr:hypothetical protein [Stellaceae bacterium]
MIGGDVISVLLRQVLLIAGPMLGVALLAWAIRGVLVVWDPWKPSPAARRRDGVASIAFIVGLLALVGAIAESMTSESYLAQHPEQAPSIILALVTSLFGAGFFLGFAFYLGHHRGPADEDAPG